MPGPVLPAPGPRLEAVSRRLGLASYPLYLGHGILLAAITVAPNPAEAVPRTLAAVVVMVVLSFLLAGAIAGPVRRLAEAAEKVRMGIKTREEIPDFTERTDEIEGNAS